MLLATVQGPSAITIIESRSNGSNSRLISCIRVCRDTSTASRASGSMHCSRTASDRMMMANGLGWPEPIRQQASTAGCSMSRPSMGAGATYLPLLVLNCSLMRPMILSWPSGSIATTSPVRKKPSPVKAARVVFRISVVAQHIHGAAHQQFALGADLGFHSLECAPNITGPHGSRARQMRDHRLGHAIAFGQVQAKVAVPDQDFGRQRGGATGGVMDGVQSQSPQYLSLHEQVHRGNAQQTVQSFFGNLEEHALLELEEKPRDREEQGGTGAVQVFEEPIDSLGEIEMPGVQERISLYAGALHNVGQRQVGEHALLLVQLEKAAEDSGVEGKSAEAVHHTFRNARGAGCVDNRGEFVRLSRRRAADGRIRFHQGLPTDVAIFSRVGEGDPGDARQGAAPACLALVGGTEKAGACLGSVPESGGWIAAAGRDKSAR